MAKKTKSSETKEQIEMAALELFGRKDFNGTSVDDITFKANVTKGALYYFFKDKNELFFQVCQMAMEIYQKEVLDKSASMASSGSAIRSLIINSNRFDNEYPIYSRLYLRIVGEDWSSNDQLYPFFKRTFEGYSEQIRKFIVKDVDKGIIHPKEIDSTAILITALLDGLSIRNTTRQQVPLDEVNLEAITDVVLRGLQ